MITDKTKDLLAEYLQKIIAGGTLTTNFSASATVNAGSGKIGQGGNSTSPSATTLDVPLSTATSTFAAVKSDTNVIEVQAIFQGASSSMTGKVIREFGIFDSSSNLLARVNFDGIGPFSSTEDLELFLTIEVE